MARKKVHKGVFHGPADDSFAQKKKVVVGNVKHSDDEKDVSLDKPVTGGNTFSNVDGESSDSKSSVLMAGVSAGSLLGSAVNTPKAKNVISGVVDGSSLGSINYDIDEDVENLPSPLNLPLSKRWIDPKVVKTPVEVAVKKFYALNINLSAVEKKSTTAKTQAIRKIFSVVNGFRGAITPSKFEGIIRSTFTSEESINKAALLAEEKGIKVNGDLKRQEIRSDWAVVIKEISMDTPKDMIVTAVFKFGEIKSIKIQLIGMWQKAVVEFTELGQAEQLASKWSFLIGKDSVHVTKAMGDRDVWASRNRFRALLFTLPVGTTAHDLSNLLNRTGGKTCIINCSLDTGNRVYCAVVGFESKNDLNSAFLTEPVFGGVCLSWARLDLVWCGKYGRLGHSALECDAPDMSSPDLLSFSNKKHALGVDCLQLAKLYAKKNVPISRSAAFGGKSWAQVVSLASPSGGSLSDSGLGVGFSPPTTSVLSGGFPSFMILDSSLDVRLASLECSLELLADQVSSILRKLSCVELVHMVSSFGAPLLVGSVPLASVLDSDMALDGELASFALHSSSADLGAGFNSSSSKVLTNKVGGLESKMSALEAFVSSVLASQLVWKFATCNVRGLNNSAKQADVIRWHFDMGNLVSIFTESKLKNKTGDINSLIAKAINESSFVVLGGNFNEDSVRKSASFKKCFDLGLVNVLGRSVLAKTLTWGNSHGVVKTIDYMFISSSLINAVVDCGMTGVKNFFDTDHKAVSVSVDLGGLLDFQLNLMCKQANKNCWKFDFGNADLDAMWDIVRKVMVLSAVGTFKKKWFKGYDEVFTKSSSRFHKLELLVSKLVKASHLLSSVEFVSLLNMWEKLDANGASVLLESKCAKKSHIRVAINKKMESFESDKGHTIRSVLEHPFHRVVLDHLVVGNKLILEPSLIKARVNGIMEGWTRKYKVVSDISDIWSRQYRPLEHVFNSAFSGVMSPISFNELFSVVFGLPEDKAAGLSGILNELLKHYNRSILNMFLLYEWEGVLTNTQPIALIETACKILSKILSDRISLACSTFDVLHGDNFSVLKGTTTQSPIFAIGSVIENALEKNRELWLVLDLLENILHYSNTESENISAEACTTYFEELDYNIIQFCEEKYPANAQFAFELESEPETTENQSEHSETAANEENNSEITEEKSIDSENKEDEMTTYIAKIPDFNGEDIETTGDANGWNATRMLRTIPYFLKGTAEEWFENLATPFNDWNAFKAAFLEQFTNNNTSITLHNRFRNIKQELSESIMTYIEKFNKLLRRIRQLETNNYYSNAQILDQFIAGLKDKPIKKIRPHAPEDLNFAI
ncbi:hypothetical protein G9A89_016382 [Geosiphon pyriformis]|nr:hypothetical protein G9A89_016382 [Geosiphon pyriformis]